MSGLRVIRKSFCDRPFQVDKDEIPVTVSIGAVVVEGGDGNSMGHAGRCRYRTLQSKRCWPQSRGLLRKAMGRDSGFACDALRKMLPLQFGIYIDVRCCRHEYKSSNLKGGRELGS